MSRTIQAQQQAEQEALKAGLSEDRAQEKARKLQVRAILQAEQHTGARSETLDRRASPLFVRAIPFQDGTYGGLLLFFKAEFLPSKAREVLSAIEAGWPSFRPKPSPIQIDAADLTVVSNFLTALGKKPDYQVEDL